MHNYSIDTSERITVLSSLGIISVYSSTLVSDIMHSVFPGYVIPLSPFVIFSILFASYNFFLWKVFAKIKFLKMTPNLIGVYKGVLKSSYHEFKEELPTKVTVNQNWTHILITSETGSSKSCSKTASIVLKQKCNPILIYSYQNDPNVDAASSMQIHYGTCEHIIDIPNNKFDASYYSGRNRNTYGIILLKKTKD